MKAQFKFYLEKSKSSLSTVRESPSLAKVGLNTSPFNPKPFARLR
jgi:hypothetical protein